MKHSLNFFTDNVASQQSGSQLGEQVMMLDDPRHRMVTLKCATDAGLVMIARSIIIKALTLLSIRLESFKCYAWNINTQL